MGLRDYFRDIGKSFVGKAFTTETTSRPSTMQPYMATDTGAKLPIFPFPLIMIYELAENIDALRIPIEALNREMFKNGFEVVEKWKWICDNCSKEFEYAPTKEGEEKSDMNTKTPDLQAGGKAPSIKEGDDTRKPSENKSINKGEGEGSRLDPGDLTYDQQKESQLQCDSCGSDKIRRPKPENRKKLKKLYEHFVNNNRQTFEDVARALERDFEVADNAYMLVLKNYSISDKTGKISEANTQIKEIMRVDPPQVALIADSDSRIGYDDKRLPVYVCPFYEHRDKRLTQPICERTDQYHDIPIQALKAVCEVSSVYSIGTPQPKRVIYGEGEMLWKAGKYRPHLLYGFSPIYAVWSKVMALSHMDEYVRKYFDKMRPPKGLLVIASRNYETFRKAWDALEQKAIEDPYMIHPLMVEAEKGGRNMAQWLDFTGSLKELEFMELRREFRQIIGAIYGVLPLYYGEMPSGWANEGMQVTLTNRMVDWSQRFLAAAFFEPLAELMGVDDWSIRLKAGEETDELREIQKDGVEIENMAALQAMGFEVERDHQGKWKVSKTPTFEQLNPLDVMAAENPGPAGASSGSKTGKKPAGGAKPGGRGKTPAPKESTQRMAGEPKRRLPSDVGGRGQGDPASGPKTQGSHNLNRKGGYEPKPDSKLYMRGDPINDTVPAYSADDIDPQRKRPDTFLTETGDNREHIDGTREGPKKDKDKDKKKKYRFTHTDEGTEVEEL